MNKRMSDHISHHVNTCGNDAMNVNLQEIKITKTNSNMNVHRKT